MSRTVTRPHTGTSTRIRAAVVAVALVGGSALASAGGATAAVAPQPVPLMPGATVNNMIVGDDAVYAWLYVWPPTSEVPIYRRSLTSDATGTTLGPATFIARAASESSVLEHDGTLVYARAADNRLVFRNPDGSETIPSWGADPTFQWGASALTSQWIVAGDTYYGPRLFDRVTGVEVDLHALSAAPVGGTDPFVEQVRVADARALWTASGTVDGDIYYSRIYTVALDENGATGPVTLLDESAHNTSDDITEGGWVQALRIVGDMVVWMYSEELPDFMGYADTVRWYSTAPYEGGPSELLVPAGTWLLPLTGTEAVFAKVSGPTTLEWRDLAGDPAVVVRSIDVPGVWVTVYGSLVSYVDEAVTASWLVDADGLPITADGTPAPPPPSFTDVQPGATFADEILWLADHGITTGYPDGTFRGTGSVNRDAMAAFLFRIYRMANPGTDAPACTEAPFTDVPATHPFCAEITWLANTGITTGWPDGTYRPGTPVTREAMAAFLYRFANGTDPAPACTGAPFTDVTMANPFCAQIAWLADTGITTGWPDGTFRPTATIERQAMAAFLFRFDTLGLVPGPR